MREGGAPSFYEASLRNQQHLRESRGRFFHQPEFKRSARNFDRRFKEVFSRYIDPNFPPQIPIFAFSADKYIGKFPYEHTAAFPDTVAPKNRDAYGIGIRLMNEWATNHATNYYLTHTGSSSSRYIFKRAYAKFGDSMTYGEFGETYKTMRQIAETAKKEGVDFDDAVFRGLFNHDFSQINQLIEHTSSVSASNIDEFATEIGTKTLESRREAKRYARRYSRRRRLNDPKGAYFAPGITVQELPSYINFIVSLGGTAALAYLYLPLGVFVGTYATLTGNVIPYMLPYFVTHEFTHAYSASERYVGFIRTDLSPQHEIEPPRRRR